MKIERLDSGYTAAKGPARNPVAKKMGKPARGRGRGDDEDRGRGRVSLRVGTGKKGRQTEVKMRRGSLRKKETSGSHW